MEDEKRERTLYVTNIHDDATQELLYELFIQAGPVENVSMKRSNYGQYAFVEFKHEESIPYALALFQGMSLFEKVLNIRARDGTKMEKILSDAQAQVRRMTPAEHEAILNRLVQHPLPCDLPEFPLYAAVAQMHHPLNRPLPPPLMPPSVNRSFPGSFPPQLMNPMAFAHRPPAGLLMPQVANYIGSSYQQQNVHPHQQSEYRRRDSYDEVGYRRDSGGNRGQGAYSRRESEEYEDRDRSRSRHRDSRKSYR